ncbi:MAG: hypothetical protein NZ555_16880, partial [Geminicoccaceae bacterium]|nr:hypothetical protein [Geminicoccaceae bacterium]MDW8371549.1 hypothetical protein [Geminicoccaceae bacterium]
ETAREPAPAPERAAEAPAVAALPAGGPGSPRGGPASFEIVFETNSSYFPKGTTQNLRSFLQTLPASGTIRVEITAAVAGADVREAGGQGGLRYNRWLAERRVGRLTDWLKENAGDRRFDIVTRYQDNDPSRRVRLAVAGGG